MLPVVKKILILAIFLLNLLPSMNQSNMTIGWNAVQAQLQANEAYYDCEWGVSPMPQQFVEIDIPLQDGRILHIKRLQA